MKKEYRLSKSALVFVEGQHKDNKHRVHIFDKDRIEDLVSKTNQFLAQGGRVPFQRDHNKTQEYNLGDIESDFYTEILTADNLPDPKYKHLIGRLGVFVDNVVAKGKAAVDAVLSKSIRTLSPGIDPILGIFAEVSATPLPAIVGPALFSQFNFDENDSSGYLMFEAMEASSPVTDPVVPASRNDIPIKAVSFDDLYSGREKKNVLEKEYFNLVGDLFTILTSLTSMSDEELVSKEIDNPIQASYDAMQYALEELEEMFGLTEESEEESSGLNVTGEDENMPKKLTKDKVNIASSKFSRYQDAKVFKKAKVRG